MKQFKERWQITENWQLLFPFIGIVGIAYSAYKISKYFFEDSLLLMIFSTLFLSFILVKICLIIFNKLEGKWKVKQRWQLIRIFIVFAITGSSSVLIGRPIIKMLGITKEHLNPVLYYVLFIAMSLFFYQILLVIFGWLFGEFKFFWQFEKKMLRRFGLGFLFD